MISRESTLTKGAVRVFIVDDHPLVRESVGNLLRKQPDLELSGEAADPDQALDAMLASPPDVALVDLSLGRGSGQELLKDLHQRLPDIRVVVLSMREEIGDIERAFRAGARGYVMKRQSTHDILTAIRDVHAGRLYADPVALGELTVRMMHRPPDRDPASPEVLTDREMEVFRRLGEGHSTRRIADDLGISLTTVQTYYSRIREKLGFGDNQELVRTAVRWSEERR